MYKRNATGWSKHLDFIILDEIILIASFFLTLLIRNKTMVLEREIYRVLLFVLVLADITTIIFFNAMHDVLKRGYAKEFSATFRLVLIVFLIATGFMFATQSGDSYSRLTLVFTSIFHLIMGYAARIILKKVLHRFGSVGAKRTMLAVLKRENAEEMVRRLLANPSESYNLTGIVLDQPAVTTDKNENMIAVSAGKICGIPIVADLETISDYICRQWIDSVYIDVPSEDKRVQKLMDDCREMAVPVHYHIPGVSKHKQKQFVERIAGSTVLTISASYATPTQLFEKRILDLVGGTIGSIFALLIIAIIGPFIKVASPGPILYRSERIGQNGKRFISCMSQLMKKRPAFA